MEDDKALAALGCGAVGHRMVVSGRVRCCASVVVVRVWCGCDGAVLAACVGDSRVMERVLGVVALAMVPWLRWCASCGCARGRGAGASGGCLGRLR